ncbi:hypothetical protein Poly51_55390 [Rubripirellula tenax]|uniref:Cytochrome C n=1 Tax=Rubripirellula tenax TaxID=2528015 RepID=A0A5C6ECH4_9BACT|nr:hypothetical protein [Rubripirellula tenax]TWU46144.1 hypothetical protein Poly51_55390 [Rubripirellula tenax]
MKRIVCLSVVVCLTSINWLLATEPQENSPTNVTPLMRMKLDKSKAILEGLTLEDYDTIKSNARSLKLLSTEAGWNVIQSKEYAAQSSDFRRAADMVVQAAEDKDIHRAALGYVALTVRCIECHSYMRKHRVELMNLDVE